MMATSSSDYVSEDLSTPGYGSELLSSFKEFREEGLFCDLHIKVEYETFKVGTLIMILEILGTGTYNITRYMILGIQAPRWQ